MKKRGSVVSCLVLLLSVVFAVVPVLGVDGPKIQLEASIKQILTVLQNDALQGEPRRQELSTLLRQRFDFQVMSQYVLGPQWRKTGKEDRTQFIDLFSDLLEVSYIGKIEAYTDEKILFGDEQIDGRKARVQTQILTASAEIPINYKLVQKERGWLVYDVAVEGISLVRTYRDTYREIARKEGMTRLLVRMQEKLDEIRKVETAS